jgi:hypothetical protein
MGHDNVRHDNVRRDNVRRDNVRHDNVRHDNVKHDSVRHDNVRLCSFFVIVPSLCPSLICECVHQIVFKSHIIMFLCSK